VSKNILRPQHNLPETVAFQTMTGVHVLGDFPGMQTLFALVDGRRLYADENLTLKIRMLDAKPLEVFVICKRKSGRKIVWDVFLSPGSEKARAADEAPAILEQLLTSSLVYAGDKQPEDAPATTYASVASAPTDSIPAAKSSTGQISGEVVTGKDGMLEATNVTPPAPILEQLAESIRQIETAKAIRPQAAQVIVRSLGPIPWNIAFREVLQFVTAELKAAGEQWSDQSRQDIASTILISAAKSKLIGIWER
jgi:hypothetical protein